MEEPTAWLCSAGNRSLQKYDILGMPSCQKQDVEPVRYKELTCRNKMFNSFTNYDVLNAVNDVKSDLHSWLNWYKDVYCF